MTRIPLVIINGVTQQMPTGDTIASQFVSVNDVVCSNGDSVALVNVTPVYQSDMVTGGIVQRARANASATSSVLGLIQQGPALVGQNATVQVEGLISAITGDWDLVTGQSGGLTPGSRYFLSTATAGMLTTTPPSTVGQFSVCVGRAITPTTMKLEVQEPIGL